MSSVLPAGTEAVTGKTITQETQSEMRKSLWFFYTFLLIFAVVAVLVGGFMMFNTFSITVAQRTRENGLLRALGAGRRQVLGSVLIEAVAVGLIASVLGIFVGLGVAGGLKNLLITIGFDIPAQGLVVTPTTIVISLGSGSVSPSLAALSPARKAAKVPPIAAMQLGIVGSTGYGSKQRIIVGPAVLGVGVAALFVGLFGASRSADDGGRRRRPAGVLRGFDPGSHRIAAAQPRHRRAAATTARHHRRNRPGERDAQSEAHRCQRIRAHDRRWTGRLHHDLRDLD